MLAVSHQMKKDGERVRVVMVLMGSVLVEKDRWGMHMWSSSLSRQMVRCLCPVFIAVIVVYGLWASSAVAAKCANETLRIEDHSTSLPDCRAFELVSPPYKDGYFPFFEAISPDGGRALFNSLGAFGGAQGNHLVEGTEYESLRTPSGWVAKAITPPASMFPYAHWEDASPDLSRTLWLARTASQTGDVEDLYVREADGSFVLVGPMLPPADDKAPHSPFASPNFGELSYTGASLDLNHVFFEIREEGEGLVWPGDKTLPGSNPTSLYEYSGVGNSEPKLVGVNNEGSFSHNNEAEMITQCGVGLGGEASGSLYNAISSSGASVFFTANAATCGGFGPTANEVYARVNKAETVHISEPTLEDCETCDTSSPSEGIFEGASRNGTKAFFLSEQEGLLPGAKGMNLYEYDFDGPAHNKLARVASAVSEPKIQGIARISEDGSHAYFVAAMVLATNKNGNKEEAIEGDDNLYVFDSVTGGITFIGILSSEDEEDWAIVDGGRPMQATPDGKFAVFASRAHLTSDDTSGDGVVQLFEYDAETGKLARISIGQKGAFFCSATGKTEGGYNCNGNTANTTYAPNPGSFKVASSARAILRDKAHISENGSTVVFESNSPLAPQAENSLSSKLCSNVYEYRWSKDEGGIANGNVSLVSDGQERHYIEGVVRFRSSRDGLFRCGHNREVRRSARRAGYGYSARHLRRPRRWWFPGSLAATRMRGSLSGWPQRRAFPGQPEQRNSHGSRQSGATSRQTSNKEGGQPTGKEAKAG